MSRRQVYPSRRFADTGTFPFGGSLHQKTKASPILPIALVLLGVILLLAYSYGGPGLFTTEREGPSKISSADSCTVDVQRTIPFLKKAYGDEMRRVLHVGPDTCSVVEKLLKEDGTEAWGVEPYDIEEADGNCERMIRRGFVRVADIKFSLPYRDKSFSIVIVSDALDYLSPRYLNRTLPDLARVSSNSLVVFTGFPAQRRVKTPETSKFSRPAKMRSPTWWIRYFVQTGLGENEGASKKFEQAASKKNYKPGCQIFHLSSYRQ